MSTKAKLDWTATDDRAVDLIRVLAMDSVQKVGNGHPGTAMSLAPAAYLLFQRVMRHDPADPNWPGRDRFVLSCGHSSLTLYIQLYLSGYGLTMDDLKSLRTWGSITPGHPEHRLTPGVEVTTGPLGQGIGNAVGMAMGARRERGLFDPDAKAGASPFDHFVYCFMSDGDIEEGISHEVSSMAADQELGNLIVLYDDNKISIEDNTNIAKSEDVAARYEAYGWHVQEVDWRTADGYHEDVPALYQAILNAKEHTEAPSFIKLKTIIGWPAPNKKDTGAAHGSALGVPEVKATKKILHFDPDVDFPVEEDVLKHAREVAERGRQAHLEWEKTFAEWAKANADAKELFDRMALHRLPDGWAKALPEFPADAKGIATRKASGEILTALAPVLPELWGGSADLAESNLTTMEGEPSFIPANHQTAMWPGNPYGRTLHFGIREHGMGAILNGIALSGGTRPYGGTFLQFSDYMRPAVRLASMMELPVTYVWTHDSIGLGEDGPTHQPIEHLWSLRNIPHLDVVRPGDANETVVAWRTILERAQPAGLCLTRQNLPVLDRSGELEGAEKAAQGGVRAGSRHRRHPDRDRQRGGDRAGGPRTAGRPGHLGPGRLHAVRGVVHRAGRVLPARGAAAHHPGAGIGRSRHNSPVEVVCGGRGQFNRSRPLRRFGCLPEDLRRVWHYRGTGSRCRERQSGPGQEPPGIFRGPGGPWDQPSPRHAGRKATVSSDVLGAAIRGRGIGVAG